MFFNRNKENKVIELIGMHLQEVKEALRLFKEFMEAYCTGVPESELKEISYKVHLKEHDADLKVKEIQRELIKGAFLPFYRENFLVIPDMIDKIPGLAVEITKEIFFQPIAIPEELKKYLIQICREVIATFDQFIVMFEYVPNDIEKVMEVSELVSKEEQKVDSLEWKAKNFLFKVDTSMERLDKFFFKDIITLMAGMADKIENISDYIQLTMIKMNL